MKYNDVLKEERKKRKLSIEAMSELLGVSPTSYGLWERGKVYPGEAWLVAIRNELGIVLPEREL